MFTISEGLYRVPAILTMCSSKEITFWGASQSESPFKEASASHRYYYCLLSSSSAQASQMGVGGFPLHSSRPGLPDISGQWTRRCGWSSSILFEVFCRALGAQLCPPLHMSPSQGERMKWGCWMYLFTKTQGNNHLVDLGSLTGSIRSIST